MEGNPPDENGRAGARHEGWSALRTLLALVPLMLGATLAHAQATAPPPTQDDELRRQLGLGRADGCLELIPLGPDDASVDDALERLGPQIGDELRAICGTSAVASASSLGGGLNSLQATKTVSQFRLVRRRIDQQLQKQRDRDRDRERPKEPSRSATMFLQTPGSPGLTYADTPFDASGLFGEVEYEWRDKVDTAYESGYESTVRGISIGLDRMFGSAVAGGWVSFTGVNADLTGSGVIAAGPTGIANPEFQQLMSDPEVLSGVCGGLPQPGTLEQDTTRFGGYVGGVLGRTGFVDASVSWARRSHDYSRGLCSVEEPGGTVAFAPDVVVNDEGQLQPAPGRGVLFQDDGNRQIDAGEQIVDDIFAGTVTGDARLNEFAFSVRGGADLGAGGWTGGPRGILTYARTTTDAFTEAGRSTVANPVTSNAPFTVHRTLGGPTGLELAYDEQSRYSLLLELGGELGRQIPTPFGAIVPHGSAFWRHEFNDEATLLTVRMAQDLRSSPKRFDFGTDAPDANTAMLGAGLSALFGARFAVRGEYRQLVADDLFDAKVISVQARLRF